ncbi:MAG TPA: ATP-binding protein [Desulfobulbaceae bacterium]|nr:ATP-binding protein [Desulfobulbaceae bacterium]
MLGEGLSGKIAEKIIQGRTSGEVVTARLSTSERILARVTDGIYRQPSSSLRELVANAYDADATHVHILTDAPRFQKIIVRDNGRGLSAHVLDYVIHSIGGSAKRTFSGMELGVSDAGDPKISPGGRRFIGKIGIGLFSIAQLTNHFQIITKVAGEKYRTFVDIILHTHSEDQMAEDVQRKTFDTGSVEIWSVQAEDVEAHGTEIVLINIKNSAKELLQSRERWLSVKGEQFGDELNPKKEEAPSFHIGAHIIQNGYEIIEPRRLPWADDDNPAEKFSKLVEAMANELGGRTNPLLSQIFDNYLSTIWTLSLAVPLNYSDGHPFSYSKKDTAAIFQLSNKPKGHPTEINIQGEQTIREVLKLTAGVENSPLGFDVFIDGIQLSRPIKFRDLPESRNALKKPLLMVGSHKPDLTSVPEEYRGGELRFEAYLFWTPKVVPADHAGVLIRINEASGTLFDPTFLNYQIAELTRLRQITAEIFVKEGLDSALNIDRESFNYSHPHYQYIKKWLHSALRQLASTQKRLSKEIRDQERDSQLQSHRNELQKTIEETWMKTRGDEEIPPEVVFVEKGKQRELTTISDIVYSKEEVFPERKFSRNSSASIAEEKKLEEQAKALASVLIAYGIFEEMTVKEQQDLLKAIVRIFTVESN